MNHPYYQQRKIHWGWGFHNTATGNHQGIGDYIRACRENNVPVCIYSTDSAGVVFEALESGSHPDDCIGFRFTSIPGQGDVDRLPVGDDDIYLGDPEDRFDYLYDIHDEYFPPELRPHLDRIWYTCINEPQTYGVNNSYSEPNAEYLARGFLHIAKRAIADGRRYACAGWAGGNPHIDFWKQPLTLEYLRLAEQHPHQIGINWHLYSLDEYDLLTNWGDMVGRYKQMYDIALANGIAPPYIIAGEAGWSEKAAKPTPQEMIAQMAIAQNQFIIDRGWFALCGWTLGEWGGSIVQDMIDFLPHNNDVIRNYHPVTIPEIDDDNGGQPPMSTEKKIYDLSQSWAFPVNEQAALQKAALADGFTPSGEEQWHEVDGTRFAMQPFYQIGNTNNKRSYFAEVGKWDDVHMFPEEELPPPSSEFKFTHWPTPHRVVTQRFRNNPDYYGKFGLPGHEGVDIRAYTGDPVFAVADGAVSQIHDSATGHNYGRFIRLAHQDGYETTYAHNESIVSGLQVGQLIKGGSVIAYADNTGNSQGSHLHLTLKKKPDNYPDRCGTTWPYGIVDPEPFLKVFNGVTWPSEVPCEDTPPPPTGRQVAIRPYFEPASEYGRKIVFRFPSGKTQPQQLRKMPDGTICLFKGDGQTVDGKFVFDYERFFFNANGDLCRLEDTSSGGRSAYHQNGAVWLPAVITEGATYTNNLIVSNWDRVSCTKLSDNPTTDYLTFRKFHETWVSPQNPNIIISDVIELEWRKSPNGAIEETYFLAEGMVYSAWNDGAIHEYADGQQPINGELWGC